MGQKTVFFGLSLCFCICCIGCSHKVLDPKQIGFENAGIPVQNIILDNLGVVDEPLNTYANAQDPYPEDVIANKQDYVFGSGDVIRINIYELREEGRPFLDEYVVTETGKISIPEVGIVYAAGRTEVELEDEIKDILKPDILLNPSVKVLLSRSESQLFSIEGQGVSRPSRYMLPRYNFRLLDALAIAGGIAQFNVDYVYVTRQSTGLGNEDLEITPDAVETRTSDTKKTIKPSDRKGISEEGLFELISPSYSMGFTDKDDTVISAAEMDSSDSDQIEWVKENGKYIPVLVKGKVQETKPVKAKRVKKAVSSVRDDTGSFGWDKMGNGTSQSRVIKIPVDKLFGGDPRYNILIRSGDVIRVPVNIIGEFYVLGNVRRQGAINLTGRPMTVVQAIAAAGGLGELAVPSKVEVTRRIARNREVIVMVDIEKIAAGHQPNFFIKPNDTINVGTNGAALFLYTLRNAFTARYGFGFTYDRNFAYSNRGQYRGF